MKQKNKEQNHNKKYTIEILVGILVSLGIFLFLYLRGYQPAGEDVYGHLYKVEFLGENIKKVCFFPSIQRTGTMDFRCSAIGRSLLIMCWRSAIC